MSWALTQTDLIAAACGSLVGLVLALIGGGGSILATPLMLYVVGCHRLTRPSAPVRWRFRPMPSSI